MSTAAHSAHQPTPAADTSDPGEIRNDFGRSVIRPRLREWFVAAVVVAICFVAIPKAWEHWERVDVPLDGRMPYAMSEDYWTYRRRMDQFIEADRIPVVGDSVIWGEYVVPSETIAEALNSESGSSRFANAGLNGAHPLALQGLLQHYADQLKGRRVILHCNLLWMSSPDRDLQSNNDVPLNHPRLVPQFSPRFAAYKAPLAKRLGIVLDRSVSLFDLISHVRTRYFDGQDLESWSVANPYANPLSPLLRDSQNDAEELRQDPVSWTKQGIERQNLPWVDLDTSLQWSAWRATALRLRANGNNVLVMVGPFNEHLLTDESRQQYETVRREVEAWLRDEEFPYIVPAALPSDEYGDASHPLSVGYARLAKGINANPVFREWLGD